jgi:hypothetical protein
VNTGTGTFIPANGDVIVAATVRPGEPPTIRRWPVIGYERSRIAYIAVTPDGAANELNPARADGWAANAIEREGRLFWRGQEFETVADFVAVGLRVVAAQTGSEF